MKGPFFSGTDAYFFGTAIGTRKAEKLPEALKFQRFSIGTKTPNILISGAQPTPRNAPETAFFQILKIF